MSAPAANAFSPAPVMTIARTLSSRSSSSSARRQLAQQLRSQRVENVRAVERDDSDRRFDGDVRISSNDMYQPYDLIKDAGSFVPLQGSALRHAYWNEIYGR